MNEATFTPVRPGCDTSRWSAPDNMGSETEVSRFLAALVDLLHPERVLETGSYLGHTAAAIGSALLKQGYGHLDSIEIDSAMADQARAMCMGLPVTIHTGDSLDHTGEYDLMFFDSAIESREAEMRRFRNRGVLWVLHDTRNPHLQDVIYALQRDCIINEVLRFNTPRGLAMGRFA